MAARRKRLASREIAELEQAIFDYLSKEYPASIRHVYYALSHHRYVGKTISGYRRIQQRCMKMRLAGELPFAWVADGSRYAIRPATYDTISDALRDTADTYRKALWRDSDVYVECWVESDSMAGVVDDVTDRYDIALMASRGFSSVTFLHRAAREMSYVGKPAFVYYLGDYDPSGMLIGENIEARLREFAPDLDITFERLLVNSDQIEAFELPAKPVKVSSHSNDFNDSRAVEAEAMPAGETRRILESAIMGHVDARELEALQVAEEDEREALRMFRYEWMRKRRA